MKTNYINNLIPNENDFNIKTNYINNIENQFLHQKEILIIEEIRKKVYSRV